MSTIVTGASGTTYISGTGNGGFNSAALIQEAVEIKMIPAYSLDTQIEDLNSELAGWQKMQANLKALREAAEALSAQTDDNVFDNRAAYLSSSSIANPDDVLAVSVDKDAALGVYEIEVLSLATQHKVASAETSDVTSALGYDGTFSLQQDGKTATEITVTSDMSLTDIVSTINAASAESGVSATLMKTSDGGFTMMLSSVDTGKSMTMSTVSGDDVLQSLGVTDASGGFANSLQDASNAVLKVDGVTVTSSSNDIEGLMPGVSISLYDDCVGETISLEVGQSLDDVASAITGMVDAFNTYREFALLNQQTDENGAVEGAVLFGESLLRTANADLFKILGMSVEVDGKTYSVADLGISLDDNNALQVDEDKLEEMLIQNPDVLQAFLQQQTKVSNSDLYVAEAPGNLAAGDYDVEIVTDAAGNITSASIDGVALEVSNKTIKGAAGTPFEGLRMVYTGNGSQNITLSVSPGLADTMVSALDGYIDENDGRIQNEIESINSTIDGKQDERDRIAAQAEKYEEYLVSYYARIEAKIEAAEIALVQVEALLNSNKD